MLRKSKIVLLLTGLLLISITLTSCVTMPWDVHRFWFPIGFPFGLIGLGIYFLPTIIAAVRQTRSILGIVLLNIFGGWTFIGWIIALVWALVGEAKGK